jgi:hypothetical protein
MRMRNDRGGGADCENRIAVGHHRPAVLGRPGAMKERQPSPRLAANDLQQACWRHAAVCPLAEMKEKPNHRVANMVSSPSREA